MRYHHRVGAALSALVLTTSLLALNPPTAAAAPAPYVSAASGRCLDVTGASTTPGALVQIYDCNGGSNQAWDLTATAELRVFGGTRCLEVPAGQTAPGTRLRSWDCTGGANQKFRHNSDGSIVATQTGLCLDVANAATTNGTAVQVWNCNGQTNQRWSAGGTPQPGCSATPVSPNSTPQARKLLCYVYSQYGNHILSGQQESTWIGGPDYEMNYIRNNTGKLPAIRGLDFGDSKDLAPRAIAWWQAGGIPMIGYHMGAPTKPDTYEGTQMSVSINAVLTPGTAEYNSFIQRLDGAANMLQQLENAGAAVIWRPFHEAGGTWFWWSKEGGAQYNRLWRFMFDYFTRVKGLNNLVWLHGYNGAPQASFYPGKSYVDIGGADTYAGDGNYDPLKSMYDATRNVVGGTIPIALHENGPIPDPDRMQSSGARWVLFGTWHGNHLTQSNSLTHLRKVYGHSYVITRDELPNLNTPTMAAPAAANAAGPEQASVVVTRGTTQGLVEPLAVDTARPEFAWTVKSTTAGSAVKAAEVEVSDARAGVIWTSVSSAAGISALTYNGPALAPQHRYRWRVRVQDAGDQWSEWSSSYGFGTAMFSASDWGQAAWITESGWKAANGEVAPRLPLVRRDFTVADRPIANATLYVSGLGAYVASVNGQRAGDRQLGSGWTKYDKRSYYDGIDVTASIRRGENTVGIALGQGFLNGLHKWTAAANRGAWDGIPRTKALLVVDYADGTRLSVPTGTGWTATQGPSLPFTANVIPENEGYDARRAQPGWDTPSFDDSRWTPAVTVSNGTAVLQANPVEPTRIVNRITVPAPSRPATGVYLYSVGKNVSGNAQITLDVPSGTSVRIRYAEKLSGGRAAVQGTRYQDDTFIGNGSGPQTWTPRFTHKGFQYVEVSGLPATMAAPALTVLQLHNDLADIGAFDSSNDVLNFIHRAGRSTVLNNLVVGVPTDGSYLEKLPWLGDGAVMAEAVSRNFDAQRVYTKWFNDLADSQSANGDMPAWAPSPTQGAAYPSAAWGNAFTEIALLLMNTYKADGAVAVRYADLKEYANLMAANATNPSESWGDWVCPGGDSVCNTSAVKKLVARAYAYRTLTQFAQIATRLGHSADAATITSRADAARTAFNNDYYKAASSSYRATSDGRFLQTSNLLPVAFGIAPATTRQQVVDNIAADVIARGNHLGTGVLGTKWLFRVLTQYGHLDTAYKAATIRTAPGYGYMMTNGATTLWEDWTTRPRSLGHPFLGTAEDWLLADVAGLADPGHSSTQVIVKPHLPTGLTRASTSFETSGGTVGSSWQVNNGNLELAVDVPVSRTGTIYVPIKAGQRVIAPPGAVKAASTIGYDVYTVSSGHYVFSAVPLR